MEILQNHPSHAGVLHGSLAVRGTPFIVLSGDMIMLGRAGDHGPDLRTLVEFNEVGIMYHCMDLHIHEDVKQWLRNPVTELLSPAALIALDGGPDDEVVFEHRGIAIDNPFISECGRFKVDPEYYGFVMDQESGKLKKSYIDGSFVQIDRDSSADAHGYGAAISIISIDGKTLSSSIIRRPHFDRNGSHSAIFEDSVRRDEQLCCYPVAKPP